MNGDLDLNGKIMNNPLNKEIPLTRGATSSVGGAYTLIGHTDNSSNNIARILNDYGYTSSTAFRNTIGFYLYNPTDTSTGSVGNLGITYNQDGISTFAPTPATDDSSTKIATTAFVKAQNYAPLASPALTGTPTAPTAATNDNSTKIATTAFVKSLGYDASTSEIGWHYVRFSNGVQICWGSGHYTGTTTLTYPKAFSSVPGLGIDNQNVRFTSWGTTNVAIVVNNGGSDYAAWIAIGKWN